MVCPANMTCVENFADQTAAVAFTLTLHVVAGLAAMRKSNEAVPARRAINTPQEFSRVKYDRELKLAESHKAYRASVYQQQQQQKVKLPYVKVDVVLLTPARLRKHRNPANSLANKCTDQMGCNPEGFLCQDLRTALAQASTPLFRLAKYKPVQ